MLKNTGHVLRTNLVVMLPHQCAHGHIVQHFGQLETSSFIPKEHMLLSHGSISDHHSLCTCSACIHELVEGGQSGVPCPLCRSPLQSGDLYDAVTEEEAEEARQAASIQGDYGSKVTLSCLLQRVLHSLLAPLNSPVCWMRLFWQAVSQCAPSAIPWWLIVA